MINLDLRDLFSFRTRRSKNITLNELRRIEPGLANKEGPYFPPAAVSPALSLLSGYRYQNLKVADRLVLHRRNWIIPRLGQHLCSSSTEVPTLCDGCGVAFDKPGFTAETASSSGVLFLNVIS